MPHSDPFVSVIVPCYKSANTLKQTLDCIIEQDVYAEIIVVNDGSPEHEESIVRAYGDRIKYVHKENGGVSKARNLGLQSATGTFVHFLDADDLILPGFYRAFSDHYAAKPDVDLMYSHWFYGDAEARPVSSIQSDRLGDEPAIDLFVRNRFANLSVLSRRERVLELGGFDTNIQGSEDWDLWIRMARSEAKLALVPIRLCIYRSLPSSLSKKFSPMWRSLRTIQKKHRDLLAGRADQRKLLAQQVDYLLDMNLRYVYGPDLMVNPITRRLGRLKHAIRLMFLHPDLAPHTLRRSRKALLNKLRRPEIYAQGFKEVFGDKEPKEKQVRK